MAISSEIQALRLQLQNKRSTASVVLTLDRALVGTEVKHTHLLDRAGVARKNTTALNEVLLADRLVGSRLVHNRGLVGDVRGRDRRADAVVLVDVLLNDRLDDVVDVVVHNLADSLALVDHAAVGHGLAEGVLWRARNSAHESSVLVGVGVNLTDRSSRNNTAVNLLRKVLALKHRLDVVLDVVLVDVVLTLAEKLLDLVAVVVLVHNRREVLHVLVHVASSHVHARVSAGSAGEVTSTAVVGRLRGRDNRSRRGRSEGRLVVLGLSGSLGSLRGGGRTLAGLAKLRDVVRGNVAGSIKVRALGGTGRGRSSTRSSLSTRGSTGGRGTVVAVVAKAKVRELALLGMLNSVLTSLANVLLSPLLSVLAELLSLVLLGVENLLDNVTHGYGKRWIASGRDSRAYLYLTYSFRDFRICVHWRAGLCVRSDSPPIASRSKLMT